MSLDRTSWQAEERCRLFMARRLRPFHLIFRHRVVATARIESAFCEGRFVGHALSFTTHTESLEPEDLGRGLGYAARLCREAGSPLSRDGKMTDVPSHAMPGCFQPC